MTKSRTTLSVALLASVALAGGTTAHAAVATPSAAVAARPGPTVRDDLQAVFEQAGVHGTFALLDVTAGTTTVVDRARAERQMVPASSFKIPHALVALETGAVKDEKEVIPYGGKPQPFPEWEKDMTLGEAIAASNAAVFQTIARRVGLKREKQWLNRLGYGNRQVGTVVDQFWLLGPLKISAAEQTRFLSRFARQQLPASKRNQLLVKSMLKIEEKDGYALYAKSGWANAPGPGVGWWVGWVERGGRLHTFALNLDITKSEDAAKRATVARELLKRLNVLP